LLFNIPKASYRVSTNKETSKTNTYTHKKDKTDRVYYYSIGAVIPIMMQSQHCLGGTEKCQENRRGESQLLDRN
jgi:hypothetical protein